RAEFVVGLTGGAANDEAFLIHECAREHLGTMPRAHVHLHTLVLPQHRQTLIGDGVRHQNPHCHRAHTSWAAATPAPGRTGKPLANSPCSTAAKAAIISSGPA